MERDGEIISIYYDDLIERRKLQKINAELLGACKEAKSVLKGLANRGKYGLGDFYDHLQQVISKAEEGLK